jgi:hypothetical protein
MTPMRPRPIYRNDCSTMRSFATLSLKLRSNTKRLLLLRKRRPKRAFFTSIVPLATGRRGCGDQCASFDTYQSIGIGIWTCVVKQVERYINLLQKVFDFVTLVRIRILFQSL